MARHASENCWLPCGEAQGACPFCGKLGACCKRDHPDSPAECGHGSSGCLDKHCCVTLDGHAVNRSHLEISHLEIEGSQYLTSTQQPSQLVTLALPGAGGSAWTIALSPENIMSIALVATFGCLLLLCFVGTFLCWCCYRQRKHRELLESLTSDLRRLKEKHTNKGSRQEVHQLAAQRGLLSPSPTSTPTSPRIESSPQYTLTKEEEQERRMLRIAARAAAEDAELEARALEEAALLAAEEAQIAAEEAAFEAELAASARAATGRYPQGSLAQPYRGPGPPLGYCFPHHPSPYAPPAAYMGAHRWQPSLGMCWGASQRAPMPTGLARPADPQEILSRRQDHWLRRTEPLIKGAPAAAPSVASERPQEKLDPPIQEDGV